MNDQKFDIVFTGQLAKGCQVDTAKRNMSKLFNAPLSKIEAMFSASSVALKKGVDIDTAAKYRIALKKAGVIVEVRELKPKKEIKAVKAMGKAVFKVDDQGRDELPQPAVVVDGEVIEETLKTKKVSTPDKETVPKLPPQPEVETIVYESAPLSQVERNDDLEENVETAEALAAFANGEEKESFASSVLRLLPAGSDVLAKEERKEVITPSIDTSALGLKDMDGPLVEISELDYPEPVVLGDRNFDLSEPGADMIAPEFRKPQQESNLDLSHLALMEVGEILSEDERKSSREELPLIDVSHLSIVEV